MQLIMGGLVAPPASPASVYSRDELRAHHQHLEALLDSALATLTLIRETTTTPALPYTPHLLAVIRVLSHQVVQPTQTPTGATADITASTTATVTTPTPAPIPTTTTTPACPHATYATVADSRRSEPVSTPEPNTVKHESIAPPSLRAARRSNPGRPVQVVIRFDEIPAGQPKPFRATPLSLFNAVARSLLPLWDDDGGFAKLIAGVQWTRNGNLVLRPDVDACTANFLAQQDSKIWAAIHPILRLPDTYPTPFFDIDNEWHSVVFHGIPVPAERHAEFFTYAQVDSWVRFSAPRAIVKGFSVLCHPEDLQSRDFVAMRVTLSSEADAAHFVETGGLMAGTWCRASYYVEKPRTRTRSPTPPEPSHPT
ncbi:hypothetical protein B0H19DRAFT_1383145 [Mycena capillaripes]|nr:hypothetical protein B0H19DRAFT_1383145 [Mycena capillaripes]